MVEELRSWFQDVVSKLVTNTDAVVVEAKEDEMGVLFTVRVGEGEAGKIIGKGGSVSESLRTILRAASLQRGVRGSMKIDAPPPPGGYR